MSMFTKAVRRTTAATLMFAAAGVAAQAEEFVMATGQQGGSWYPVGGAIKAIVEREHPDITITVTPARACRTWSAWMRAGLPSPLPTRSRPWTA